MKKGNHLTNFGRTLGISSDRLSIISQLPPNAALAECHVLLDECDVPYFYANLYEYGYSVFHF